MGQNRSRLRFIEKVDDAVGKELLGGLEDVDGRRVGIRFGVSNFSRIKFFRDFGVSVLRQIIKHRPYN
jgi:hypothetical protein